MSRILRIVLVLAFISLIGAAEVAPAPAAPKPAESGALGKLAEEEKWTFEPPPGRPDIFIDIEAKMIAEKKIEDLVNKNQQNTPLTQNEKAPTPEQALEWTRKEIQRVEGFIVARRWDDAIKTCDNAVKMLTKYQDVEAIRKETERLKAYRSQAEEAKIYEEAQAKFDALNLRIEGILWSPTSSLAVITGEPRARGINDRVKDCVIINIDTNRVDFLFHYNRRRFEFQRYVGEETKTAGTAKPKAK